MSLATRIHIASTCGHVTQPRYIAPLVFARRYACCVGNFPSTLLVHIRQRGGYGVVDGRSSQRCDAWQPSVPSDFFPMLAVHLSRDLPIPGFRFATFPMVGFFHRLDRRFSDRVFLTTGLGRIGMAVEEGFGLTFASESTSGIEFASTCAPSKETDSIICKHGDANSRLQNGRSPWTPRAKQCRSLSAPDGHGYVRSPRKRSPQWELESTAWDGHGYVPGGDDENDVVLKHCCEEWNSDRYSALDLSSCTVFFQSG